MRLLVFLMLSAWPVVASPGRPGATATLVNRTGRIWQIKADACASMETTVWLTVTGAGRSPAPVRVEAVVKQDVALELPPGAHVQFTHMEAPGTEVGRFFELLAMDAESAAQGGASEGYLFFQTYATWFGLGQDRTCLSGAFYAQAGPAPFQLSRDADESLALEPAPEPAPGCVVS
jgi:hypothetical protein